MMKSPATKRQFICLNNSVVQAYLAGVNARGADVTFDITDGSMSSSILSNISQEFQVKTCGGKV